MTKMPPPPPTLSGILLHLMVGRIITTIVQKGNKRREKQVDIDFSIYIILPIVGDELKQIEFKYHFFNE